MTKKEVLELRKKLNKKILLVIDDAYAEYMKNSDYVSGLDLFKNKENVFILRTFSKIYGLSSLRVGWGYGSKRIIDALNIIKSPFNVNEVAQKAAVESLKDNKFISRSIKHNIFYATKLKESPLTVEAMDVTAIIEAPSSTFYESIGNLKGVDITSASLGFKIINTRGFNSTSPVRSLQIIDGVDNQSPGLNFSLGNFLGTTELDTKGVEIVVGANSALYGPNAFNGVIDMTTKDPFMFPGTSYQIKLFHKVLTY